MNTPTKPQNTASNDPPMNPVIPAGLKDGLISTIEKGSLEEELAPPVVLEGCTGDKKTCTRVNAPLCKVCMKI